MVGPIGQRIAERHTDLKHLGAAGQGGPGEVQRGVQIGIAGSSGRC